MEKVAKRVPGWVVAAVLIVCGAVVRWWLQEIPNFAPVSALALFAGCWFERKRVAVLIPLGVMALSDLWIGGYSADASSLLVIGAVYAALATPALLGAWLRGKLASMQRDASGLGWAVGLAGCGLMASLFFFLVTNFAVWTAGWYEPTLGGLATCYVQAIPFFRFTLAGDACFSVLLFGGAWALAPASGASATQAVA